jgi:hypothetical protein
MIPTGLRGLKQSNVTLDAGGEFRYGLRSRFLRSSAGLRSLLRWGNTDVGRSF